MKAKTLSVALHCLVHAGIADSGKETSARCSRTLCSPICWDPFASGVRMVTQVQQRVEQARLRLSLPRSTLLCIQPTFSQKPAVLMNTHFGSLLRQNPDLGSSKPLTQCPDLGALLGLAVSGSGGLLSTRAWEAFSGLKKPSVSYFFWLFLVVCDTVTETVFFAN